MGVLLKVPLCQVGLFFETKCFHKFCYQQKSLNDFLIKSEGTSAGGVSVMAVLDLSLSNLLQMCQMSCALFDAHGWLMAPDLPVQK